VKIHASCDVCQEREIPMCIQVCNPRALSLGRRLAQTLTQADKSSGEES
jgi:Fe-S-cluster-containing hydrogenase component 2